MAVNDDLFIHIPTAGDHYSPRTGSAAMSVIYKLSCEHAARGGETLVVVGRGTCVGYPPYSVGKVVEADLPAWIPPRHKRVADALLGRLFSLRPFTGGTYSPAADAIGHDTRATVFVHTIAPAVPYLRRLLPNAKICLYIHNQVLGRYGRREMESLVRACDVVIGVSKFIAEDFEMRLGRSDKKVRYLLNGVDTEQFCVRAMNRVFRRAS
ncbi:MAG: glycosyltransferase [Phycisphaerae bacterium]